MSANEFQAWNRDLRVETVSVWIFDVLCISLSCLKGWTDAQDSSRLVEPFNNAASDPP